VSAFTGASTTGKSSSRFARDCNIAYFARGLQISEFFPRLIGSTPEYWTENFVLGATPPRTADQESVQWYDRTARLQRVENFRVPFFRSRRTMTHEDGTPVGQLQCGCFAARCCRNQRLTCHRLVRFLGVWMRLKSNYAHLVKTISQSQILPL